MLNTWRQFPNSCFYTDLTQYQFYWLCVVFSPYLEQPVFALAWAVLIGGIAQLAFQLLALAKIGMLPWPRPDWHDAAVRRVVKQMGPAIFGSFNQSDFL